MSMMQNNKIAVKSGQQMQSIFFRDLATPVSSSERGKFTIPGQAAPVFALWRDNFGGSDPAPPPVFTLNDQPPDFSPDSPSEYPTLQMVDNSPSETLRDPLSSFALKNRNNEAAMTHYSTNPLHQQQHSPSSLQWWTPVKAGSPSIKSNITGTTPTTATNAAIGVNSQSRKGSASTVFDAVVQPGALMMVTQPREVARPDTQKSSLPNAHLGEETWVTLYGFSLEDTNLVLREFEKCSTILRHVAGPVNSNWVHILLQTRFDAQKALTKNGTQINGLLIIGVKHLDPSQHPYLDEMSNSSGLGFMLRPAPKGGASAPSVLRVSSCPLHLPKVGDNNQPSVSTIASPTKSTVSKIMDLMFGV